MKHLLRELEELVSKEIKLLDVSLADWHFVALEHSQGLVLKVKELRANIAKFMDDTRVSSARYRIQGLQSMLEALPAQLWEYLDWSWITR